MTWFVFCYWYETDAAHDPVGIVRVWTLAETLARMGDRVTVFPPRYRSAFIQRIYSVIPIYLIPVSVLRPLSYALFSFASGLMRALVERPHLIYYRWMDSPHAVILAKLLGVPCICEVNGEPVPEWHHDKQRFVRNLKEKLARMSLRRCDRIVVLTDGLRSLLHQRYGIPMDRIALFPSGTDIQRFVPRDAVASRLELGLAPTSPYVGFVGSFYQYQGLSCLLDAVVLVRQACPTIQLLLVGDGETADELKEQARRLGLEEHITWTGRIPYWEVPVWIGAMNLCVAPFRGDRGETSPVKIFDYLACQRPVIASAIPSVLSTFTSESGVQFVPADQPGALADAILALLNDPGQCTQRGTQGRRFVEGTFSWTVIVEQLRKWVRQDLGAIRHAHSHVL